HVYTNKSPGLSWIAALPYAVMYAVARAPSPGATRQPSTPPRFARGRSRQALLPEGEGLVPSAERMAAGRGRPAAAGEGARAPFEGLAPSAERMAAGRG